MPKLADLLQELLFARDEIAARAWGNAEGYQAARDRQEAAKQQITEMVQGLVTIGGEARDLMDDRLADSEDAEMAVVWSQLVDVLAKFEHQ